MRISEIQIKNFKSLKNVALTGLKNLVVLIGKNSSGKSNMLDALNLFFNAFNLIEPASIGPITEFDSRIWHDIRIELPIEVVLRIEFNSRECEEIFPGEALKIVRERSPESYNQVIFCRRIVDVKTGWKTEYVKWSDVPIVLNNKLVSPEDFRKSLITPTAEATSSTAFSESAAAKMIGKVASSLHNRVKGNFTLVRVTRDSSERPSDVFERAPIVDSETCEMLRSIGQSRKLEDIKHWAEIEKTFEVFSSMRLDVREGEIYARKNNLYLPMHLIGGGDQEVLILKRLLM
ncbi:MAG: AAA family ATPase, partial [Candidatus Bathyarchaeia archaeon]